MRSSETWRLIRPEHEGRKKGEGRWKLQCCADAPLGGEGGPLLASSRNLVSRILPRRVSGRRGGFWKGKFPQTSSKKVTGWRLRGRTRSESRTGCSGGGRFDQCMDPLLRLTLKLLIVASLSQKLASDHPVEVSKRCTQILPTANHAIRWIERSSRKESALHAASCLPIPTDRPNEAIQTNVRPSL